MGTRRVRRRGVGTLAITWCFAEASSCVSSSAVVYGFVEAAFGRYAGFLAGVFTYVANVLAAGAIAAAAADTLASLFPALAGARARAALILGWFALLGCANTRGVAAATRLVEGATLIKLAPLLLFLVVGVTQIDPANLPLPAPPLPQDFGRALLLAMFLFAGVHGALSVGGEVRNPARTIPRATLLGMGGVTLLFVGCQFIAQGMFGERAGCVRDAARGCDGARLPRAAVDDAGGGGGVHDGVAGKRRIFHATHAVRLRARRPVPGGWGSSTCGAPRRRAR